MKEIDKRAYDRRVVERHIQKGAIKNAEFQTYLKNLPDETNNAQWVQLDLHDTELGEVGELEGGDSDNEES